MCSFFTCSAEFQSIVDVSLKTVVDELMQDVKVRPGGSNLSGVPLAKLLPQITQMGPLLLEEPSKNRFIHIIRNLPVVEVFFTLLYANMPPSQAGELYFYVKVICSFDGCMNVKDSFLKSFNTLSKITKDVKIVEWKL